VLLAPDYPLTVSSVPTFSGNAGVFHTLQVMREMVDAFKADPTILHAAVSVIYLYPQQIDEIEADALYRFVRDRIRYVRDPVGLEAVATPVTTLQRGVGDCDDQTTLLAAMLEAVGYPTRFVLAGYRSQNYEHVFLEVLASGQWIAADPILKSEQFGYEAPGAVSRYVERI
jgi:hypothetical protein